MCAAPSRRQTPPASSVPSWLVVEPPLPTAGALTESNAFFSVKPPSVLAPRPATAPNPSNTQPADHAVELPDGVNVEMNLPLAQELLHSIWRLCHAAEERLVL